MRIRLTKHLHGGQYDLQPIRKYQPLGFQEIHKALKGDQKESCVHRRAIDLKSGWPKTLNILLQFENVLFMNCYEGSSWLVWEPRDGLRSLRPLASTPSVRPSAPKPIIQPPHNNSFIKHFSNFIKILRDFGHPSFKSLAQLKTRDSFRSRFKSLFSS